VEVEESRTHHLKDNSNIIPPKANSFQHINHDDLMMIGGGGGVDGEDVQHICISEDA
jgi:hypothetical protein